MFGVLLLASNSSRMAAEAVVPAGAEQAALATD